MFNYKRQYLSSIEDVNAILSLVKKSCCNIYFRAKGKTENFKMDAFIEETTTSLFINFKRGSKAIEYIFDLTGDSEIRELTCGAEAFRILSHYFKVHRLENYEKYGSAVQLLYRNPKFDGKRIKAWSYDMNSAFAYMLIQPMPDTEHIEHYTYIKPNQIGFYTSITDDFDKPCLKCSFEVGKFCDWVCDLVESPFKKFVEVWYDKKKKAKTKEAKMKAKQVLNFAVGSLQNYNPLIRATVVGRCNLLFESLIDENTIYSCCDSIVSCVPRDDLEARLGNSLGQFKIEHQNEYIAFKTGTFNYQWNYDLPSVRGTPKNWYKKFEIINHRKFDILKDTNPDIGFNEFVFNRDKLKVEENK